MNRTLSIIIFIVLIIVLVGMGVLVIKKPKGSFSKPAIVLCIVIIMADIIGLIIVGNQVFHPKEAIIQINNDDPKNGKTDNTEEDYDSESINGDIIIVKENSIIIRGIQYGENYDEELREFLKRRYDEDKTVYIVDDYADFIAYSNVLDICRETGVLIEERDEKSLK